MPEGRIIAAKQHHLPERANIIEKTSPKRGFFLRWQGSNLQ